MPDPITWTATEAELQRDLIAEWLRGRGLHELADEIEQGVYLQETPAPVVGWGDDIPAEFRTPPAPLPATSSPPRDPEPRTG